MFTTLVLNEEPFCCGEEASGLSCLPEAGLGLIFPADSPATVKAGGWGGRVEPIRLQTCCPNQERVIGISPQ